MSRLKNRRLRIAANEIRKGSGIGGMSRALGGKLSSSSKYQEDLNQNILRLSREILENLDGALLGKDIKARANKLFSKKGQAEAIKQGEQRAVATDNPFERNFNLYNEDKRDSSGEVAGAFQCSDFAPKISVNVKKLGSTGKKSEPEYTVTGLSSQAIKPQDARLSVLSAKHFEFCPTNALTSEIEVFANAIPTHELSRCVPYLDVNFFTPTPSTKDNKPFSLSLAKALVGDSNISNESGTKQLAQSYKGGKGTQFGMELFTLPQTVTPLNRKGRTVPILDPFRPLMSITSFDVSVVPAAGLMEKRKAKLSITLHDRSRLHEVAEFVRPQNYAGLELLIEYGWSHPDSSGRNAYGEFLNAMRKKEKYRLYNSSFSLQNNGEVSITLELVALGVIHTEDTSILNNNTMKPIGQAVGNVRAKVQAQLKKLAKGKVRKDIKPLISLDEGLLSNATVYAEGNPIFDKPFSKKSIGKIAGVTSDDVDSLITNLESLKQSRNQFNSQKKILIEGIKEVLFLDTADPFFPEKPEKFGGVGARGAPKPANQTPRSGDLEDQRQVTIRRGPAARNRVTQAEAAAANSAGLLASFTAATATGDKSRATDATVSSQTDGQYITLGKLFSFFVGRPLAATNNFSEVQLFFYAFSTESGFQGEAVKDRPLSNYTIDQFLIKKEDVVQVLDRMMQNLGTAEIPIETFMNYIIRTFVVYPFAPLTKPDMVDDEVVQATLVNAGQRSSVNADSEESIREKYKAATEGFRPPKIQVMFDAIPLDPTSSPTTSAANEATVLRVHIFDNHTGRHATIINGLKAGSDTLDLLKQANKAHSTALRSGEAAKSDPAQARNKFMRDLEAAGVKLKPIKTGGVIDGYMLDTSFEKLKKVIKRGFPSLTYGADGSVITSARFNSLQSSGYKNTMMKRAGRNTEMTARGTQPNGLPLQIQPADATITMLGCPIIRYAQHFFVDFGTGTSMDDLYFVKTINHKISPGTFTTSLSLANRDGDAAFQSMFNLLNKSIKMIKEIKPGSS
jgi:hypothetical protein